MRKLILLAILLTTPALAAEVTCPGADYRWTYLEQTRAGEILSRHDVCWYADPDEIGCWDNLEECTDEISEHCQRNGTPNGEVSYIALRRSKIKGELVDECQGACADSPRHTITIYCSADPPEDPWEPGDPLPPDPDPKPTGRKP